MLKASQADLKVKKDSDSKPRQEQRGVTHTTFRTGSNYAVPDIASSRYSNDV